MIIIDNNNLLTAAQRNLLLNSAALNFNLGGYTSLTDILDSLNVEVHIVPGIRMHNNHYLIAAKEYWENNPLEEITHKNLQIIGNEIQAMSQFPLRGLYIHEEKKILLFPDEMRTEYDGERMDELLVSTLAHETMHAYFNRPGHDCYPYVYFVEEPLAEFGMLLFLKDTGSTYLDWAYNDVQSKCTCYHYGASLYDKYKGDSSLRDYLEKYKIDIPEFFIPDVIGGSISLPSVTPSARTSSPIYSHSSSSTYRTHTRKLYTLIAQYSTNRSKNCIFNPAANRGFINIPDPFGLHYTLLNKLNVSSKGRGGRHLQVSIIDTTGAINLFGDASIFKQKNKYSMHLSKALKNDFQTKFRYKEPIGVVLNVAFYKNVNDDYDWLLVVK